MVRVATIAFGSRWRNMMTMLDTPSARAASTYSKFRARRNSARTTPTSTVQPNSPSRRVRVAKPGTSTAETIMIR